MKILAPFVFAIAAAVAPAAAARQIIPLETGWVFAFRPTGTGLAEPSFDTSLWQHVTIPHTWNAIDGEDGGNDYARGDGWYRLTFTTRADWAGQRLFIQFSGADRVTEVWLNGHRVGEHRGGFAAFRFDLTEWLAAGGHENLLAVRVNNETGGLIPISADFTFFGGLYREVSLIAAAPTHFALMDYGSPGIYLTPRVVSAEKAEVSVRSLIESARLDGDDEYVIHTAVRDAAGNVVKQIDTPCRPATARTIEVAQTIELDHPHLWQGRAAPYLYRTRVELRYHGAIVDEVEQPLGLRTFTIDATGGFFLNGKPYPLRGVSRHQDRLDKGWAIGVREHREDLDIIEEMGATAIRLCHYQHAEPFYAIADTDGMVVWTEIPFVNQAISTNPDFADNAVEQLRELIRQNYNHPSILCWGLGNETDQKQLPAADALLQRLAAVAKQEDSSRYTTYASHHPDEDPRNFHTDLLGYNRYFGWYSHNYDDLGPWLDQWHLRHPSRPLAISEYGAGASIYEHEQSPPARTRTQAKGPWHPEEWQNEFHEHAWAILKSRPYLWATFIWNMFDFAADNRREGDTTGRNDKGLVTYDRRTRKDAFYWYKANWTEAPLVYITSRRDWLRFEAVTEVKVYSNCDAVDLTVNGVSLGTRRSTDRRFIWQAVQLQPGPNRLVVTGAKGGRRVTDSCAWTLTAGKPYRPIEEALPASAP